jgi:hypothetical protein
MFRRLFIKAVQQGRSERRGESYSLPYGEPLSDARTPVADFFNSLLKEARTHRRGSIMAGDVIIRGGMTNSRCKQRIL